MLTWTNKMLERRNTNPIKKTTRQENINHQHKKQCDRKGVKTDLNHISFYY